MRTPRFIGPVRVMVVFLIVASQLAALPATKEKTVTLEIKGMV